MIEGSPHIVKNNGQNKEDLKTFLSAPQFIFFQQRSFKKLVIIPSSSPS